MVYKSKQCPDVDLSSTAKDYKTCSKRGDFCSMFHSEEEKELALKALYKVPADVQDEGYVTEYLEQMNLGTLVKKIPEAKSKVSHKQISPPKKESPEQPPAESVDWKTSEIEEVMKAPTSPSKIPEPRKDSEFSSSNLE